MATADLLLHPVRLRILQAFLGDRALTTSALSGSFPHLVQLFTPLKVAVFGLTIVLFLVFEPDGLADLWRRIRNWFRLYPFSY